MNTKPVNPESTPAPARHPLLGKRVLIPRRKSGDTIAQALTDAGATPVCAALTRTLPGDAAALDRAARALLAGEFDWLVLTSARTVSALAPRLESHLLYGREIPVRVAAVGQATKRAWWNFTGQDPQLTGTGSAASLLAAAEFSAGPQRGLYPERTGRILLPISAIAPHHLDAGLTAAGWEVTRVDAYRTVTASQTSLPAGLTEAWSGSVVEGTVAGTMGSISPLDAVILTAGSTVRAALELLGPPPPPLKVVAIGQPTAKAARELNFRVDAIASAPTPAAICQALESCFKEQP